MNAWYYTPIMSDDYRAQGKQNIKKQQKARALQ